MNIQYTQLYDFIKKDNEIYIQVYASVYFYDNTNNNFYFDDAKDKYWNDIWIITYKETGDVGNNCNCTNCGAVMEYNKFKDLFECQYCGNVVDNRLNKNWEIVDIELGNVEYEI